MDIKDFKADLTIIDAEGKTHEFNGVITLAFPHNEHFKIMQSQAHIFGHSIERNSLEKYEVIYAD